MELINENVRKVVAHYQALVPDYEVSRLIVGTIVDNRTDDDYFEKTNASTIENTYSIIFRKGDEIISLEKAITKFNLPELEKVLLQV